MSLQNEVHRDLGNRAVHQPSRNMAAGDEEWIGKNQEPESEPKVASPAHVDRSDEIAETNAFPAREVPHTEQTA
jgi:hypothetical protein